MSEQVYHFYLTIVTSNLDINYTHTVTRVLFFSPPLIYFFVLYKLRVESLKPHVGALCGTDITIAQSLLISRCPQQHLERQVNLAMWLLELTLSTFSQQVRTTSGGKQK